jgi:hypothetical protein
MEDKASNVDPLILKDVFMDGGRIKRWIIKNEDRKRAWRMKMGKNIEI